MLLKPDKDTGVVLINKNDYVRKLSEIISDEKKFSRCSKEKDETEKVEGEITGLLKALKLQGHIDNAAYGRLNLCESTIPRLYGPPKIHKEGAPTGPIMPMVNSLYHAMAQWLVELLEPIRRRLATHSLRDSFQFVGKTKDLDLQEKTMFSLDVVSLFTNVPLLKTVESICDQIKARNMYVGIPVTILKELLLPCTRNVQRLFNSTIYRQMDGVVMGSPLVPLLAGCFVAKLERSMLSQTIEGLAHYSRYMDDIFCVIANMTSNR
ncbi:unnamed protein product [Echinostoma caproni]|uniref:Reverse transcriptase domain-containing protein n=1 Tax=Echinostoma caproni TaxID=27848 RepID=A0A183A1V7_9TREM|nr:unnamed protein product [Echinostoma caproni]